jgi:hypothetical protein
MSRQATLFRPGELRRGAVDVRIEVGPRFTAWIRTNNTRARRLVEGNLSKRQWDHQQRCWMLPKTHLSTLQAALSDYGLRVRVSQVNR